MACDALEEQISLPAVVPCYSDAKTNPDNIYEDKEMPAPSEKGDVLLSQMVYYKIRFDLGPTKPLMRAVDALRPKFTQGDPDSEKKRAIVCGKDQTVHRTVDLLGGLSEELIAELTEILHQVNDPSFLNTVASF